MKPLANFIKTISDANRLSIIYAIGDKELSVTGIIAETGLSQTLVSFHLRTLRDARVVATRREGPFIYYRLAAPSLLNILDNLAVLAGSESDSLIAPPGVKSGKILSAKRR